jgi:heterodisulfide reductase subunit A
MTACDSDVAESGLLLIEAEGSGAPAVAERVRAHLAGPRSVDAAASFSPERRVLVIGGDAGGMLAALETARHGIPVTLIESAERLGSVRSGWSAVDGAGLESLDDLAQQVESNSGIDVRLSSDVLDVERTETGFTTSIQSPQGQQNVSHGAIVVAGGADDVDPCEHVERADGLVVTQAELVEQLRTTPAEVDDVVIVQCVGSRSNSRPYCSRACCAEALAAAARLRSQLPEATITVLHRGIRVWGFDEGLLSDAIDAGVRFVRVVEGPVVTVDNGPTVAARDADSGEDLRLTPDLVVLSTGVRPRESNRPLASALGLSLDADGFFMPADPSTEPVSAAQAIYTCGLANGPASPRDMIREARAAAGKACLFIARGVR